GQLRFPLLAAWRALRVGGGDDPAGWALRRRCWSPVSGCSRCSGVAFRICFRCNAFPRMREIARRHKDRHANEFGADPGRVPLRRYVTGRRRLQVNKKLSFPDGLGFRDGAASVHTSRTLMLAELSLVLQEVGADAPAAAYGSAIVEENVLGKP